MAEETMTSGVPPSGGHTPPAAATSDHDHDNDREPTSTSWWRSLGPGLITGAADDDPSGIATYTQAGAQFGYAMGWTVLVTCPLMIGIQLASARIGRITGRGLTENFARLCPAWSVRLLVALLVVANVLNLGADLNAMAGSLAMIRPGPQALYAAGFGIVSLLLQVFIPYRRYVRVLKWLTLSLLAYVGVAFAAHVDWLAAARGAVWPQLHWSRDATTTVVALLGTTISPYLFFWQAAQEVEEIHRVPHERPLRRAPEQRALQLRRMRIDTVVGMLFSNLIAFFMLVAAAATLHQQGIHDVETTAQAAEALRPVAGDFAFGLFAAGLIGTGLLALPVLAGSAAYAVASLLRVTKGLDQPPAAAKAFYAILAAAMLVGIAIGVAGLKPIDALYWSAVVNAVIAVPIMAVVMSAASSPRVVGDLPLPAHWRWLGWAATVAMAVASIAMGVQMLAGGH